MTSLAERLGYAPDAKLLIVNCDDLGSSASANRAIAHVLAVGAALVHLPIREAALPARRGAVAA